MYSTAGPLIFNSGAFCVILYISMYMLRYSDPYDYMYTRNSEGYRCAEFSSINWSNSIAVFGCSEVFGVSVPEDQTLPHHLSLLFGRPCINLGIPGASNRTIGLCVQRMYRRFGVTCGIILWTVPMRYRYWNPVFRGWLDISIGNCDQTVHEIEQQKFLSWATDQQAVLAEWKVCRGLVQGYIFDQFTVIGENWQCNPIECDVWDYGADGSHSGGRRNKELARRIKHACIYTV